VETNRSVRAIEKVSLVEQEGYHKGKAARRTDLGLGLDADVEGLDAGGEGARDALPGEGVEEVEARVGEAEEAAPLLHHRHAGLVHAAAKEEEGVHHLARHSTSSGAAGERGIPSFLDLAPPAAVAVPACVSPFFSARGFTTTRPCVWVDAWKQEKRFVVSLRGSVRDLKTATNVTAVSHIRLALIALVNLQFFLKKLHLLRPWQRNMRNLGGVQKKTCTVKTGENYKWLNFVGGGGVVQVLQWLKSREFQSCTLQCNSLSKQRMPY